MQFSATLLCLLIALINIQKGASLKPAADITARISRRELFQATTSATVALSTLPYAAVGATSIASRLSSDNISIPSPSYATELNGVDNLYFPNFMEGAWAVTQTLVNVSTPLGLKYVGGPNGLERIAAETMAEASKQVGKPVNLKLRFVGTRWGVAEDRIYNTKQRLDAFAGRSVVSSVEYSNVSGSNRASVLAMGGTEEDPLQTTFVRFKGPAAQKTFVVSHGSQALSDSQWVAYELDRGIFALTNQNTAPPLTTDSEIIWMLEKRDDDYVQGKLRIAGYLNPNSDVLYFDARQRAVSIQDYTMDFKREKQQ